MPYIDYGITRGMPDLVETLAAAHFNSAAPEHGMPHAVEVRRIALECLPEGADPAMRAAIALLHDADDYKQFPDGNGGVPNALRICRNAGLPEAAVRAIGSELRRFGYAKRLEGLAPATPEGMAASDADMISIMGASGIIRLAAYDAAVGMPFFDPFEMPNQHVTHESYVACQKESAVRHMFDKILRLPGLMLTEKGRAEAGLRQEICAAFLSALFREQGQPGWNEYLRRFLAGDLSPGDALARKE